MSLLSAFHRSLPLIAGCGLPIIIDHVIERYDWMRETVDAQEGYDVFFVKMDGPLEELQRRDIARGDQQIGFAKMQHSLVHRFGDYDAEVNARPPTQ